MSKSTGKRRVRLNTRGVSEELFRRIASGRSINEVCADADMPNDLTVYRRMHSDPEFHNSIRVARAAGLRGLHNQRLDLSEAATVSKWVLIGFQAAARKTEARTHENHYAPNPSQPLTAEDAAKAYLDAIAGGPGKARQRLDDLDPE